LPAPDAVFVGGGASEPGVLERTLEALAPGGRLVAHPVTLETEAVLLARHAALGGELLRVEIQRAGALGSLTAWRPALPITQWCWRKP
jgi:precorrin-6B C5,15-methyltransferase / cobalt-precorrin-6B C5,C15-methyltransferase